MPSLAVTANFQELASSINSAVERSKQLYASGIDTLKQALLCDREAGSYLIQVKTNLPHGQFSIWVENNCKFTPRYAQMLMSVSRNWDKIMEGWQDKCETGFAFEESPLPSLKQALSLIAAPKEKEEKPQLPPAKPTEYKVATNSNGCKGEVVRVKEELHNGDVIMCETSKGDFPFLRQELIPASESIIEVEIVEEITEEDKSEQLKDAIALIIEYLPEKELKTLLTQSLYIGKDYLPEETYKSSAKLVGVNVSEMCL